MEKIEAYLVRALKRYLDRRSISGLKVSWDDFVNYWQYESTTCAVGVGESILKELQKLDVVEGVERLRKIEKKVRNKARRE